MPAALARKLVFSLTGQCLMLEGADSLLLAHPEFIPQSLAGTAPPAVHSSVGALAKVQSSRFTEQRRTAEVGHGCNRPLDTSANWKFVGWLPIGPNCACAAEYCKLCLTLGQSSVCDCRTLSRSLGGLHEQEQILMAVLLWQPSTSQSLT